MHPHSRAVKKNRRILRISYKDHAISAKVCAKIRQAIGPHEDLLTMVKRRKLKWHGRVSRSSGLAKTIMQGTVKGRRRQSRQKQRLEDNIKEMTGQIPEGSGEQRKMEETGCEVICGAPTPPAVKG